MPIALAILITTLSPKLIPDAKVTHNFLNTLATTCQSKTIEDLFCQEIINLEKMSFDHDMKSLSYHVKITK